MAQVVDPSRPAWVTYELATPRTHEQKSAARLPQPVDELVPGGIVIKEINLGIGPSERIESVPKKRVPPLTCGIRQQESRKRVDECTRA